MADIYDVQVVLSQLAQQAIYPNGTSMASVGNCDVRIYPGWPIPASLDADLTAQKVNVSIFPSNIARATTRFATDWDTVNINSPTLTLTINGNQVTVGGTVSIPQACMVFSKNISYSYGVQSGDTLNTIASQLADLIPNATALNNVITIGDNPYGIIGRVIVTGSSLRELSREARMMIVTVWAPTPQLRSVIGNAISVLFSATYRPALPDGSSGQLKYSGSREEDILEKVKCYRRDIHFIFEYGITQGETNYTVGDTIVNILSTPPNVFDS